MSKDNTLGRTQRKRVEDVLSPVLTEELRSAESRRPWARFSAQQAPNPLGDPPRRLDLDVLVTVHGAVE